LRSNGVSGRRTAATTAANNKQDPWDLLRSGRAKQGLKPILERYREQGTPSRIMELGVAYLWARGYKAARDHFQHAIANYPRKLSLSSFYQMGGAAAWCMDEPQAAVACWESGLDARFADAGVVITLPLLLFAASILRAGAFPQTEAEDLLRKKLTDPRSESWPGPLARLVLGEGDAGLGPQLDDRYVRIRRWRAGFYQDILEFRGCGLRPEELKERMRERADTSRPEWAEQSDFLNLLWNAEFFIARHEASA
jgi:hypothetical protein